jgi:hypothetical protein
MGDFIGGVYVCLPLVGGKIARVGDLKREDASFLGCIFLLIVVIPKGDGTLVAYCLTIRKGTILEVV